MSQAIDTTPVLLRGFLGKRFGTETRHLAVGSPAEAIQALCATVPGFEMAVRTSKTRFKILLKNVPVKIDHLGFASGGQEIRIVPVVKGAKSDGVEFLEGVALIVAAYFSFGASAVFGAGFGAAGGASAICSFVGYMGVAMAIGGISRMLVGSPSPQPGQSSNTMLFSGAQNTVAQGIPVPVLYGDFYVTPPLISEALDTESFSAVVFGSPTGTGGNNGGGQNGGTIISVPPPSIPA